MPGNLKLTIDIAGERQFSRTLHGMVDRVQDLSPAFAVIAADWSATMEQKFAEEGAFEGSAWKPLGKKYARWKERHFPDRGILERTGKMRKAATNPETTITPSELRMVIPIPYAIYHQSNAPRVKLPRRPFASLTARQKGRFLMAFRDHIAGQ